MTHAEWLEAVRLYNAYWPHSKLPPDTIAAWFNVLADRPGHRVQKAIFELAETSTYPPSAKTIRDRCKEIARTEQQLPAGELTPFGADQNNRHDRQWNALPAEERAQWVDKAIEAWPPLPNIRRESPIIQAHAAYLARRHHRSRRTAA